MSTKQTTTTTTLQPDETVKPTPGSANNTPWNASGNAFAPNTNVLDTSSMPSDTATAAREKTARIMAALKAGDTATANALLGKDETKGRLLPGVGWVKKKLNNRGQQSQPVVVGQNKEVLFGDSESDISKV